MRKALGRHVALAVVIGAVSLGTALSVTAQSRNVSKPAAIPAPISFHEVADRGLLVNAWINGKGPFSFAIDTGAGALLLSPQVASEAGVTVKTGRAVSVAGISGAHNSAQIGTLRSLAVGFRENFLPARGEVLITNGLPREVDGLVDPTEALWPLGYTIDIPRQELVAFDPNNDPVRASHQPEEGAVVRWLHEGRSRRPFVQLDTGERALLDTGSGLGLAIKDYQGERQAGHSIRDIGGGRVEARRVAARTIAIGSLTLRHIPTDLVSGAETDAPVLLGLAALRPFRIRFDPLHNLIEIAPRERG